MAVHGPKEHRHRWTPCPCDAHTPRQDRVRDKAVVPASDKMIHSPETRNKPEDS